MSGWKGRHTAEAAIRSFGCSLLSALERHCKKYASIEWSVDKKYTTIILAKHGN